MVALALAVLALGAAAHALHHSLDPDCDDGRTATSHPCLACSGLHGGVLAAESGAGAPFVPVWTTEPSAREAHLSTRTASPRYAPRAPPIA